MKYKIILKIPEKKIQVLDEARKHFGLESIDDLFIPFIDKIFYDYLMIKEKQNNLTFEEIKNAVKVFRNHSTTDYEAIHESEINMEKEICEAIDKEFT